MTTTLTMRIDDALKTEANELFEELGLNMTTAFTCFLKKCLDIGGLPFKIGREHRNRRLIEAIREAEEIANDPNAPYCDDPAKLREFLFS